MCADCDQWVDTARESLSHLMVAERRERAAFPDETPAQHVVRLAGLLIGRFHETGHDVNALCLQYALTIQKLIAVQEIYGIPTV